MNSRNSSTSLLWRTSQWCKVGLLCAALALAGTMNAQNVTVNPGAGSYANLKGAFDAINAGTHTGAVTVAIVGNTTETTTAVLNASGVGAASYTTIAISPSGGAARTITGAMPTGQTMVDLNGADNVTIDGLNTGGNSLTISNTTVSTSQGTSTISLRADAVGNTITRCSILGSSTLATGLNGGTIIFGTGVTTGNDNNTISFCDIGPAGSNLPSKGIFFGGGTGAANNADPGLGNSGNVVTNNNIFDYFYATSSSAGVYAGAGTPVVSITNNKFYQSAPRAQTIGAQHSAIWISNTLGNNYQVTGNTIGFANSGGTGTYSLAGVTTGSKWVMINVNVGTTAASNISNNTIAGIAMSGTTSGTSTTAVFRGIYVVAGVTTTNGNTIGDMGSTGSITYTSTSTSTSDVIGIHHTGDDWTANNNNIGGITVANSSTGASSFYGFRTLPSSVTYGIDGNTIGGTVANSIQSTTTATAAQVQGFHVAGTTTSTITGNTVRNLTAAGGTGTTTSASVIGINLANGSSQYTVSRNTIHTLTNTNVSAATVVTGIQSTGSAGPNLVERNLIHGLTSATNSATAEVNGIRTAGGTTDYRNNMIAIGAGIGNSIGAVASNTGSAGVNGISEAGGINTYFHNSVYIGGTATAGLGASFAFNGTTTTTVRSFRDNIFFNARSNSGATGKHYAVKTHSTTTNLTIDNNVYFANGAGAVFGYFNADVANLAAWRTAVGQDLGSFEGNPQYNDPTNATPDLHLHPTNVTIAEANGVDVGVTNDYDGQTRAGLTPVDIGADAGNFTGVDLSPPTISYTAFDVTCSTGNRILIATIADLSGVPTTGSLQPRIYFRKNAGAWFSSQGSLSSGTGTNGTWDLTIVAASMGGVAPPDVIQYYVIAQDVNGNVGSNPGPGLVASDVNTVTTAPTSPNSYAIQNVLAGTYTVGVGGAYTTLTAAVAAYNSSCVGGAVVFELIDATYNTGSGEVFPITINANLFSSSVNTLTIRPASGNSPLITATVTSANGGSSIKLNGADWVIIDGSNNGSNSRDLTIENLSTATSGTAAVWLASPASGNGSTNNVVKNCIIKATSSNSGFCGLHIGGSTAIGITTAGLEQNNNNTVHNNLFRNVSYGLVMYGMSTAAPDLNNVITNNNFGTATSGQGFNWEGIHAERQQDLVVSGNDVQNVTGTLATNNRYGIRLLDLKNGQCFNNNVHDLFSNNNGQAKLYGIAVASPSYATMGTPSNALVYNNFVSRLTSICTSTVWSITGMVAGEGYGDRYYHNSVSLTGQLANSSGGKVAAFANGDAIFTTEGTNIDVRNNIFSITGSNAGTAGTFWAYYTLANGAATAASTIDYNVMHCAGTGASLTNFVGRLSSGNQATLLNWQTASGTSANSVVTAPVFTSTTDLHLVTNSNAGLSNMGTPIAAVTTDIDGDVRSLTSPDMGADEFDAICAGMPNVNTSSATTATTVCNGGTVSFTNNAVNPVLGVVYQWQVGPIGGPYVDVVGGTGAATQDFTTAVLTAGTYGFVMRARCTNETPPAGDSFSNEVSVTVQAEADAGTNGTLLICANGSNTSLSTQLGGSPDGGGSWTDPSDAAHSGTFVPGTDAAGIYTYTVAATAPCTIPSSATVTVTYDNTDTDGDGIIDCLDNCPNLAGQQGDYCDVNNGVGPFLFGQINGSCMCAAVACTETVTMELRTDNLSSQASWQILLQGTNQVVCQFSVPINGITTPITENCCLPVGCYRLRVSDSGGDGFVSGGITGGYQLRESGPTGRRIIDNLGNFTNLAGGPPDVSAIANTYDNGAFCVPLGTDRPIFSSCDKLDWVANKYIVATENAAVTGQYNVTNTTSGYEFWFFDPNGTYSFRRFRNHATSDGFGTGATRACHFRVNAWTNTISTPHLPSNVLLNVRIRGRANNVNAPFGPACLFKIDAARAACPLVSLQDNPLNSDYSCGVNRYFGGANTGGNRIIANPPQPVPTVSSGSVRYQFRFRNGEYPNPEGCIVRPPQTSAQLNLNWSAATGTQLKCNTQYDVDVRVSLDGGATWCVGNASSAPALNCADPGDPNTAWGKVCSVNITTSTNCPGLLQGGSSSIAAQQGGDLTLYPNPNRGDLLFISLTEVGADVNTVSVDIYDMTGKRVSARTIAVQDGFVKTALDLNGAIANGMYMVNITAGDKTYTERLVIQP